MEEQGVQGREGVEEAARVVGMVEEGLRREREEERREAEREREDGRREAREERERVEGEATKMMTTMEEKVERVQRETRGALQQVGLWWVGWMLAAQGEAAVCLAVARMEEQLAELAQVRQLARPVGRSAEHLGWLKSSKLFNTENRKTK